MLLVPFRLLSKEFKPSVISDLVVVGDEQEKGRPKETWGKRIIQ